MDASRLAAWFATARPDWVAPGVQDLISLRGGRESDVFRFSLTQGAPGRRVTEQRRTIVLG